MRLPTFLWTISYPELGYKLFFHLQIYIKSPNYKLVGIKKNRNEYLRVLAACVENVKTNIPKYSSFGFRLWDWIYCIKKALSISVYHVMRLEHRAHVSLVMIRYNLLASIITISLMHASSTVYPKSVIRKSFLSFSNDRH